MTGDAMFHKKHPPAGARPGTLVMQADAVAPVIRVIDYTPERVDDTAVERVEDLRAYLERDSVTWIDVSGLGDETILRALAEMFDLHPLLLEDIVNVPQRPKSEAYDNCHLLVTRMVHGIEEGHANVEQVSIVVGRNYVLSFQERSGDVFDPVRTRIHQGKGPMRRQGPDYLAYALLDAVVDRYYPILEQLGDTLEGLETQVLEHPTPAVAATIHRAKRQLLLLRRSIWPQRDAVNRIIRDNEDAFSAMVRMYLKDVYDHCVQLADVIESYREMTGGLLDLYLSTMSNRTNEIMRVLTIMASVFIPLTFLAGVYGMNFDFMPELHMRIAYPLVLLTMFLTAAAMVWFFAKRGWLTPEKRKTGRTDRGEH